MKKTSTKYLLLLIISLLSFRSFGQEDIVINGKADIKKINIKNSGINLNGTWEFYKNHLYSPKDFINNTISKPGYLHVPGLWNNIKEDTSSTGIGYGTYRLQIFHTKKNKLYGVNLNRIQSSYKIWINNQLLKENGIVGKNKKTSKPRWSSSDIIFKANGDTTEIILQVCNFYHKKGGIENSINFAEAETLIKNSESKSTWNIILLGIFLIMAAYHFATFLFHKNDKSNLYFSLTLIFSALFSMTVGEILLTDLIPSLNWELLIKTNYISNWLRLLFFSLFIYHAFPKELNKLYFRILAIIISAVIIFVLAVPAIIYTKTLLIFLVLTGITLIYIIFGQIKAIFKNRPGAIYSFIGILVLLGTSTNDILKELQIINTISLTIFGIFIFIIFHSYLITLQNAFSYQTIKRITKNIEIKGKVRDALFSADSYELTKPLKAISQVIKTDRSLIFINSENNWIATNEYIRKTDTANLTKIKIFSGKEHTLFSSINVKKAISSKTPVYTIVNESVIAKDMKYLEGSGIYSILSYPLVKEDVVVALLYFENYSDIKNFDSVTLEILDSIKQQILVFTDNFASYNDLTQLNLKLEKEVDYKTKEIETRTEELKILRTKLENQNIQISETSQKLEKQTEQINDGINYSEKIQKALLPDKSKFQNLFPESFIWHKTNEKFISTFYWFHQADNKIIYASVNSHGSNISSALISILTTQLLNDIIIYKHNDSPKIILNQIQENFEIYPENIGAVDIAILQFNTDKQEILYSGANNSIFYSYENNLIEYKSSEDALKSQYSKTNNSKHYFSNRRIYIKPETKIFLCSGKLDCKDRNNEKSSAQKKELIDLLNKIKDYKHSSVSETFNHFFNTKPAEDILITGIKF